MKKITRLLSLGIVFSVISFANSVTASSVGLSGTSQYAFSDAYTPIATQYVETPVNNRIGLTSSTALSDNFALANTVDEVDAGMTYTNTNDVPMNEPVVPIITENPGQLASVMTALGRGDVVSWFWLASILVLTTIVALILYFQYAGFSGNRYREYSSYDSDSWN